MCSKDNISTESVHFELQQVQNIVNRQASNSFKIKKWTITLVAVSFLFKSINVPRLIGFVPLIGFWYLDAYYLRQERLYRELYDWIRDQRPENSARLYDLSTKKFDDEVDSVPRLMFSETLRVFYIPIGILLIVFVIVIPLPSISLSLLS